MDSEYSVLNNESEDESAVVTDTSQPAILEQITETGENPENDEFDSDGDLATGEACVEHASFLVDKDVGHIMHNKTPKVVFFVTFFAGLGQFLAGYHTGVIATAMLVIRREFSLDLPWQAAIVSGTVASAACFALIGYFMNQTLGRKYTSLLAAMFYTVGAIILGIAWDKWIILIGRVVVGCGLGISSVTLTPYIRECVPSRMRGGVVAAEIAVCACGLLTANVVDATLSYNDVYGWRIMTGITGVPSFAMLIGMLFLPESPAWLIRTGNDDKSRRVLMKLRGTCDVMDEMDKLHESLKGDKSYDKLTGMELIREMWSSRKSLCVGSCLHMFKQLTGINVILNYSGAIIAMAGIGDITRAMWLSTGIAAVNAVFTWISIAIANKISKKTLTVGSYIGVFISLVVLALSYELDAISTPPVNVLEARELNNSCSTYRTCEGCSSANDCGFCQFPTATGRVEGSCEASIIYSEHSVEGLCSRRSTLNYTYLWTGGICPTPFYWISIVGLAQYVAFYAFGLSTTTRAINNDLYPASMTSLGLGLSTATNWVFTFLVTLTFPSLTRIITKYGVFWMYAGCSFVGIIFVLFGIPQTDDTKPKKSVAWNDEVKVNYEGREKVDASSFYTIAYTDDDDKGNNMDNESEDVNGDEEITEWTTENDK